MANNLTIEIDNYMLQEKSDQLHREFFNSDECQKHKRVGAMDGVLFLAFWFGGALLHTLYDLKIKHFFTSEKRVDQSEQSHWYDS